MRQSYARHFIYICLLVWSALAEVDPRAGVQFLNQSGREIEEQQQVHKPAQLENGDLQVAEEEDYEKIFTQKTMDLLSEAVAMLNRVRDIESKRWLEGFVFKIGQVALKLEESSKNNETNNKPPREHSKKKQHRMRKSADIPVFQKQEDRHMLSNGPIQSDVEDDDHDNAYFSDVTPDNAHAPEFPAFEKKEKSDQQTSVSSSGEDMSQKMREQNSNIYPPKHRDHKTEPFHTSHRQGHAHNKETTKIKKHPPLAGRNAFLPSRGRSRHNNKNASFTEPPGHWPPYFHHSNHHHRNNDEDDLFEFINYSKNNKIISGLLDFPTKPTLRQFKKMIKNMANTADTKHHNGTKAEAAMVRRGNFNDETRTSESREDPTSSPHNLKKTPSYNHHVPPKTKLDILALPPHFSLDDNYENMESQLKAGKVILLSDSVVRSNFAERPDDHK